MSKEVLKIALEALEPLEFVGKRMDGGNPKIDEAITAIKATLEAKDEPLTENGMYRLGYHNGYGFGEAYGKANAPERTWVGLTEKDICEAAVKSQEGISPRDDTLRFAIAIEAKLKQKNEQQTK